MTFKIKMLTAAAVLALPGAAIAQDAGSAGQPASEMTPPVEDTTSSTTDTLQDSAGSAADANVDAQAGAQVGAQAGPVTQATAADIQAGASVRDQAGGVVGTIESVSAEGAVVSTGTVRAQLPIASFGKDSRGLVIAMTKTQLEAAAGARSPG